MKPRRAFTGSRVAVTLLCAAFTSFLAAQTPAALQCYNDDNGQLYRVLDASGNLTEYVYDPAGNILQVKSSTLAANALAVLNVTPSRMFAGATITILGQNFSPAASANLVTIGGVPATVVTATATSLTVLVPPNATGGVVSLTVGGVTTSWSGSAVFLPLPTITAISPIAVLAGTTVPSLTVTGTNLTGASFSFFGPNPNLLSITDAVIPPSGTSATFTVAVNADAFGHFVLTASNATGSSSTTSVRTNTLVIPGTNPNADPDLDGLTNAQEIALGTDPLNPDTDGDGFYDGLEVLLGSDPLDPNSKPTITQASSGLTLGTAFSIQNSVSPLSVVGPSLREQDGLAFSVQNGISPLSFVGPSQREQDSLVFSVSNTPPGAATAANIRGPAPGRDPREPAGARNPDTLSPRISISYPRDAERLLAGQTITVRADAVSGRLVEQVAISVNGVPFVTGNTAPYQLTFTVPSGVSSLTFSASATDSAGHVGSSRDVTVQVTPDPKTTVSGRVVNSLGGGMNAAGVETILNGLRSEFFHFKEPLKSLPDLVGRSPGVTGLVSAINLRNPHVMFGSDPFGAGLARDYAGRFTGWIRIAEAGSYQFLLGADEGARLNLNGGTVVYIPAGAGEFHEGSGTITLPAGLIPIEVTFYASAGSSELQLSWIAPNGERRSVTPELLVPDARDIHAITNEDGAFSIPNLPGWAQSVQVRAIVKTNEGTWEGISGNEPPIPGGITYVDGIVLGRSR